jgi:hypothetical protein
MPTKQKGGALTTSTIAVIVVVSSVALFMLLIILSGCNQTVNREGCATCLRTECAECAECLCCCFDFNMTATTSTGPTGPITYRIRNNRVGPSPRPISSVDFLNIELTQNTSDPLLSISLPLGASIDVDNTDNSLETILKNILANIAKSDKNIKLTQSTPAEFKKKICKIKRLYNQLKSTPITTEMLLSLMQKQIVVNPGGSIAIGVQDPANPLQVLANEIANFFYTEVNITINETITLDMNPVTQNPCESPCPQSMARGGYIVLLGGRRKIRKEGRSEYVIIKGHKVPLKDAIKFDAKIKKMKSNNR